MAKKIKWFKSAFSQETESRKEILSEVPCRRSESFSNTVKTISLVDDDDDDGVMFSNSKSSSINDLQQLLNENWLELFAPQTIDDLAVNPKKIAEIQDWLKHYENTKNKYPTQMLLLSGPTGSGKTTTIQVISKAMNYEVIEWINPVDIESFEYYQQSLLNSFKESQITIFKRFLFRSSRYKSVIDNFDRRLILIEDFPNVFIREPNEFHNILSDYRNFGKSPIIFIVADSKTRNLNIAHNLFPDHIKSQYNIADISLNAISTTLMKNVLKKINNKLKQNINKSTENNQILKILSDDALDDINLTANGDIRNAILNLRLISIKGVAELPRGNVKNSASSKRNNKSRKLLSINRDETLTTMHALGRVLYPKYDSTKCLVHSSEEIADAFTSDANNFLNLIHANYLTHFKCIENVINAVDTLSLTDNIMNEFRTDINFNNIGLCIAIRGVMTSYENSSHGWAPIKGVHKYNEKKTSNAESQMYTTNKNITNNVFATDYKTYMQIIYS